MKKLKISEWINKVVYTNDEINLLDDGTSHYIADAITGLITFQVQFVLKDMKVCLHILKSIISQYYAFLITNYRIYHTHKKVYLKSSVDKCFKVLKHENIAFMRLSLYISALT
jgi:hypothetical protein